MSEPIFVIGAGIGGLSAAIRLQAAGQKVIVLERNRRVGGKMGEVRDSGYRWDTGPSVLTMRGVFEELFEAAGRKLDDFITLDAIDPLTRYFFPDGSRIDIHREIDATVKEISAYSPQDAEGYRHYLEYVRRLHAVLGPVFIYNDPPSWRRLFEVSPLEALRFDGIRTMQRAIDSHVTSGRLRKILGRFATYVGASPFQAPATLNVIGHVELNEGVWYPRGGMYRLARALEQLAIDLGVEFWMSTAVQEILVQAGQVSGLRLEDGRQIRARTVLANVDVRVVYEQLLPPDSQVREMRKRLQGQELSSSGFILELGVRKQHPELMHHNIFFSSDYRQEFGQIFRERRPPSDPTIYVAITSKSTKEDAPEGCENWFVLVNVPPAGDGWGWDAEAQGYRDLILQRLKVHGYDIEGSIEVERMVTPLDLERQSGAWKGALYGSSSNSRWAAFRRVHNRASHPRGLYFAGGTTHPGGGVPMAALSGRVASDMILADGERE